MAGGIVWRGCWEKHLYSLICLDIIDGMANHDGDQVRAGELDELLVHKRYDALATVQLFFGFDDAFAKRAMRVDEDTTAFMVAAKEPLSSADLDTFSKWLAEVKRLFLELVNRPSKGERATFTPANFPQKPDGDGGVYETLPYAILQNAPAWWKMLDGLGNRVSQDLKDTLTQTISFATRLINSFNPDLIRSQPGSVMLRDLLETMPPRKFQGLIDFAYDPGLQIQLTRTALNNLLSGAANRDVIRSGKNAGWNVVSEWRYKKDGQGSTDDDERTQAAVRDRQVSSEVSKGVFDLLSFLSSPGQKTLWDEQAAGQQLEQVLWIIENKSLRVSGEINAQIEDVARHLAHRIVAGVEGWSDNKGMTAIRLWLAFEPGVRVRAFDDAYGELSRLINKYLTAMPSHDLVYSYLMNLMRQTTEPAPAAELPAEMAALVMRFYGNGQKLRAFEILTAMMQVAPLGAKTNNIIRALPHVVLGEWFMQPKSVDLTLLISQRLYGVVDLDTLYASVRLIQEGQAGWERLRQAMPVYIDFLIKAGNVNTLVVFLAEQQKLLSSFGIHLDDTNQAVE